VGFPNAELDRPVKLLRGFAKITLSMGERKTVRFTVRARDLAYFDPMNSIMRVELAVHEVLVGGSSRAADLLRASFRIT